ncbi:MAG TPA: chloride channel protein [Candidatus Binataceae bacterium]
MLKELIRWRPFSMSRSQAEYLWLILLASAVGFLAALGNLLLREFIRSFIYLFRVLEWNALRIPSGMPFALLVPLVLVSGGVAAIVMEYIFGGDILGYGFPKFLEKIHLGDGRIGPRWIITKALGPAISLGAGASVGREGPIAQVGGAIGSAVAQLTHLSSERAKVMIACGAGAGIATTFNAPLGGLLFAQEIVLLGQTELGNLSLLVISTSIGVLTSRVMLGDLAVLPAQRFVMRTYWEILTFAILGVAFGILAALYIRFFNATAAFFDSLPVPRWARVMIGMLIVGVIAIPLRQNLSDGYPVIDLALNARLEPRTMALLFAAKFVASSVSLGCGMPGGVFGPIFFIGAMGGGAMRSLVGHLMPRVTGVRGTYALVGLGAFLAGTTHAPLTAIFLLTEMTGSYDATLAALISSILALVVARSIEPESIDTYALARRGISLEIDRDRLALSRIASEQVMKSDVTILAAGAGLEEIFRVADESAQEIIPVVGEERRLVGVIAPRNLVGLLLHVDDLKLLVNAADVSRADFPTVSAKSTLEDALHLMEDELAGELPVVDTDRSERLLGIVTRHDIAEALTRATGSIALLGRRDTHIFWSTGYRVTRIRVPPAAHGKTLRQLNTRLRFGVSVLAIQNGADPMGGFELLEPDQKLKTGDVMIAAGRSAGLRSLER